MGVGLSPRPLFDTESDGDVLYSLQMLRRWVFYCKPQPQREVRKAPAVHRWRGTGSESTDSTAVPRQRTAARHHPTELGAVSDRCTYCCTNYAVQWRG